MAAIVPFVFNIASIGMSGLLWTTYELINAFSSWDNVVWLRRHSTGYSREHCGCSGTQLILTICCHDCTIYHDNSRPNPDGVTYARSKPSTTNRNGNCC